MKLVAIEPTPNPNSMKLNLDESLPAGVTLSFAREDRDHAPAYMRGLLEIPGVRSLYQVADFIALERQPQADWRAILAQARAVLDAAQPAAGPAGAGDADPAEPEPEYTGTRVLVQVLRGIPMQIKLLCGLEESRVALPERFSQAAMRAAAEVPDVLAERRWVSQGVRYGDVADVGAQVRDELSAAYSADRLADLVTRSLGQGAGAAVAPEPLSPAEVARRLGDPNWKTRYAALEQMEPEAADMPLLVRALADPHHAIRRLAVVYLADAGGAAALPHLVDALQDPSAAVRRAAGDCLSDLGDPAATPAMAALLHDPNKLVRWRAARFLYEAGDVSALPALRAAEADPEFEVSLQIRMAIERIAGGKPAAGPAWQQMTRLERRE